MKTGIVFKSKPNYKFNKVLSIFDGVNTSKYLYYISFDEVLKSFDLTDCINCEQFTNMDYIGELSKIKYEYLLIDLDIYLFKKNPSTIKIYNEYLKNPVTIKNYNEYFKNEYYIMNFVAVDLNYFTIYCKNQNLLDKIYYNIKDNKNFYDIEFFCKN